MKIPQWKLMDIVVLAPCLMKEIEQARGLAGGASLAPDRFEYHLIENRI